MKGKLDDWKTTKNAISEGMFFFVVVVFFSLVHVMAIIWKSDWNEDTTDLFQCLFASLGFANVCNNPCLKIQEEDVEK